MNTLQSRLETLAASVRKQLPASVQEQMDKANERLAGAGLQASALRVGQQAPDFVLPDASDRSVSSTALRAAGPVVLTFYRGGWCPYCNLELRAWQTFLPALTALGTRLAAISPQTPDASWNTAQTNALGFPVLSDQGNQVARRFGLVFTLDESLRQLYPALGIDLSAHNGDGSGELPVPATYLVGSDGRVVDVWLDTDYRRRPEPAAVIARIRAITR